MMFDKSKCSKCKYSGHFHNKSYSNGDRLSNITCDYSKYTGTTCLHAEGRIVVDRRGDDPKHCKLFEKR